MKLRYKVISFSSQDSNFPVSNLITGKQPWESGRFCQYPQQITIQFYEPIKISTLVLVSHSTKIPYQINILFCLPSSTTPNESFNFQKYGYVTLTDNVHTKFKGKQMKKIQNIDRNILYMRIILWKNHQNPHNFFNQVALSQLNVYGTSYTGHILPHMVRSSPFMVDDFIQTKLQLLNQFRDEFTKQDDFQSAKQIKEISKIIKIQGEKLKKLDLEKKQAIQEENYDLAKQYKQKMELMKQDLDYIATNFYDPGKKTLKPILKDSKLKLRIDELMIENNSSVQGSRVKKTDKEFFTEHQQIQSQGEEEEEEEDDDQYDKGQISRVSYENQIVPAVLHKGKKDIKNLLNTVQNLQDAAYEGNEFIQKQSKVDNQEVPQDLTPSAQANASVMFEFYDKEFVKKLHSKNWNFKHEAITQFVDDMHKLSGQDIERNRIKCTIFVFNRCIKEGSFPISSASLDVMDGLCKCRINKAADYRTELHNDLEKAINQLINKMSQSPKFKEKADEILPQIFQNELFGVKFCYSVIVKAYQKQIPKIKKIQLQIIELMVNKYAIDGGHKSVPNAVIQFGIRAAEQTNGDVRKAATDLLITIKNRGGANKLKEVIEMNPKLKNSIIKQLV